MIIEDRRNESKRYVTENRPTNDPDKYAEETMKLIEYIDYLEHIVGQKVKNVPERDTTINTDLKKGLVHGHSIWSPKEQRVYYVGQKAFLPDTLDVEKGNALLSEQKDAFIIPFHLYSSNKYTLINGNVTTINLSTKGREGLCDQMYMWIPNVEEQKYTMLSVSFYVNHYQQDIIKVDTQHFRQSAPWTSGSYNRRSVSPRGAYNEYVLAMLKVYREASGKTDFAKRYEVL